MVTEYCKMTGDSEADSQIIKKAADIIRMGGLVAIPTETVYGLAGSALMYAPRAHLSKSANI